MSRVAARQIAHTLSAKGVTAALRVGLMAILARELTPDAYGAYSLILTVGTFGVLMAGLNLGIYVYRAVPGREPSAQLSLFKTTFLFEVGLALILVVIIIGGGLVPIALRGLNAEGYEGAFALGLVLLVVLVALSEATQYFTAQARIEQANWVDILSQAAWVLPFAAWWALGLPITVLAVIAAQLAGGLAALWYGARQVGSREWYHATPAWHELRTAIGFSVPMIVPGLSLYVLRLADRFILSSAWGLEQVGIYAFAYTFVNMLYTFTAWAIFKTFGPRIIAAHNEADHARRDRLQSYMVKIALLAFVGATAALLVLYDPVVSLVARPEYLAAARPLPLLALCYVFIILTYPADNMLFMQDRVKSSAAIDLAGMAVGIAANLLLVPRWSYMGAAVASTVGFGTIMLGKYAFSGTLSSLRPDVLFSFDTEARMLGSYLVRWRS
ncbi:MAG: lipopolysaccharide biosynthesis protein [Vicinamibacterales bacterium]